MKDNEALIAQMESAMHNYTNSIILVPAMAILATEIAFIIQSAQGTKAEKKNVVNERISQAIESLIIKMPNLSVELTELKNNLVI